MSRSLVVLIAYDGIAADEAGAITEILQSSGIDVIVAARSATAVTSYHGRMPSVLAVDAIEGCRAVIVPGGMGVRSASEDPVLLDSIRQLGSEAEWLGATSTGSILLAAAGLAEGARATTHWLAQDLIESWGVIPVDEPFVEHGRLLTASGLGSSSTLAFRLVGALSGVEAEAAARAEFGGAARTADVHAPVRWRARTRRRLFNRRHITEAPPPDFLDEATELVVFDFGDVTDG